MLNKIKIKITKYDILKIILGVIINFIIFCQLIAQNKKYTYSDPWGKEGCEILNSDSNSIIINFSINQLYIADTVINGIQMQNVNLKGIFLPNDEGSPDLPRINKLIAIPQYSRPIIKIISYRTEIYQGLTITPAPAIPLEKDQSPLQYIKNNEIYGINKNYPSEFVTHSELMQIRNLDCFILGICPFQFNPVTKELIVYRDIKIEITFEGGNGHFGDDAYRCQWFDQIFENAIYNYTQLPKIEYNDVEKSKTTGYQYIIISPTNPEFLQWADSLKKFRIEQGISTTVASLGDIPDGNTANGLKIWIKNAYDNWSIKPVAILLLGDYGTSITNSIISPVYHYDIFSCSTDNQFADINNDQFPDLAISRLPAENAEQLQVMVSKCLNYERTPPLNKYFYEQPITALGWQTERWYQICAETVGGFWKYKLHKNPFRINSIVEGKPSTDPWSTNSGTNMLVNYFGPTNLNYIPNTPQELGGFEGGDAEDIINGINSGAFIVFHRDHGEINCWSKPYFCNSNISSFVNKDLSFVLSINCSTGKFDDPSECLAEKFLRFSKGNENLGAMSVIAATNISYSFHSDVYLWGMIDYFWGDFMPDYGNSNSKHYILPAFGNIAGKLYLKQYVWYSKSTENDATFNLFHMFGDAFQIVYDEVPKNLTVSHNPFLIVGANHFNVTADTGSCIVITANDEIIAKSIGTGSLQSISIPPQSLQTKIVITVTKKDYIRYRKEIETMNINGPYFIITSNKIADPLPNGNNNGFNDYGETNFLDFTLKNIGPDSAKNIIIKMNTLDEFVNIENGYKIIETLPSDSTINISNFFKYTIANNIPDKHNIKLIITVTCDNIDWGFEIDNLAYAPILSIGYIYFSDKLPGGNNNGKIEIDETIEFTISSTNIGHSEIKNINGILTSSDPNIIVENNCIIDKLNIDETNNVKFSVKFNEDVSEAPILFNYKMFSGNYQAQKEFLKTANIFYEDWETKNFNKMPWKLSGNGNWHLISGIEKYEGYFSAKSGKIKDNEESNLDITYTTTKDDTIYFYKKVSSDICDYLKFYIDDLKQPLTYWSGKNVGWTFEKFPVKAGTHLFRWQYMKNFRTSAGEDCAWIDCIVFPKSADVSRFKKSFSNNIDCFPNPFNTTTTISYSIENESTVSVYIYNIFGEKLSTLINNETQSKGYHQLQFVNESLSPGIYYILMNLNEEVQTKKIIITKLN